MSHYVTPFLVLNLGSEMVFVIAQRLQAQNIAIEKTNLVLDEIVSVLISKQLITELMKPQAVYNHESVRDIIEDVTQSSMMRLDEVSMGKLWDLITMVFKWQLTMSHNAIELTLRHLYEIETYITNPETQLQLHKVQNLIDNFNKILSKSEKEQLKRDILYWLKESNVRVSLLLRMGLQKMDGTFVTDHLNPVAEQMMRNLGENIYAVTKNGKILDNEPKQTEAINKEQEVNELQLFVDQMLGDRKLSIENGNILRLTIDNENNNCDYDDVDKVENSNNNNNYEERNAFDKIHVESLKDKQIRDLVNDMDLMGEGKEEMNMTQDLLEMIGGVDINNEA